MSEDAAFRQRVAQGMAAARGTSPEEAVRSVLLGSVDEVKSQVAAYRDAGVEEIYCAQWPRTHIESLRRFSEEVIPAFS